MASPLIPDDQQQPFIASPSVTTSSGSGSATNASGSGNTTGTNSPQANLDQINSLNQGFDFSPLLGYVQNQGTAARNAIGTANNTFNTGLGSFAPFGTDQQSQLSSVINGSSPLTTGQNILNTTYTGPSSVDRSTYDPLVNQYVTSANQTTNTSGIDSLLGTVRPDLTPGERSYDALVFGQNPTYQTQSRNLVNDANDVKGLADSTYNNSVGAVSQRQNDVNAFNKAAQGYVQSQRDSINSALNNQISQAGSYDQGVQNLLGSLSTGQTPLSSVPTSELAFNPASYQPQTFTGKNDTSFSQTVNPYQFLTYVPGQTPTRQDVATPNQVTQYNNAEDLLGLTDQLSATPRTPAEIGFNAAAFQAALQQAQAAAQAADAAWLASHQPVAPATPTATTAPVNSSTQEGGGNGGPDMADAAAAAEASPGTSDVGSASAGAGNASAGGNPDAAAGSADSSSSDSSNADSSSGSSDSGPGGSESDSGFAKGGMIRPQGKPVKLSGPVSAPSPMDGLARLLASQRSPIALAQGGYLAPGSDTAGIPDTIPARVNAGEFVVRQPSVAALGPQTMAELNNLDRASPAQQAMVRNALQTALRQTLSKR